MIREVRYLWQLDRAIRRWLEPVGTLLDLGAGARPQTTLRAACSVAVDVWRRYRPAVVADLRAPLPLLDASVDVVWCSDVIEHLERDEGFRLLAEMARVARRGVVVRTPLGFHAQDPEDVPWKEDREIRNPHQTHLSGWMPEDLLIKGGVAWVIPAQPEHSNEWYHAGWFAAWRPRL